MKKTIFHISYYSLLLMGLVGLPQKGHCDSLDTPILSELRAQTLRQMEEIEAIQSLLNENHLKGEHELSSLKVIAALQKQEIDSLQTQLPSSLSVDTSPPCPPIYDYISNTEEANFYVEGDYLLWRTLQNCTVYALQDQIVAIQEATGNMLSANYDWGSGYRLIVGGTLPDNFWSLEATYTHFKNQGSDKIHSTPDPLQRVDLISPYQLQGVTEIVKAKADLSLSYNTLDILLGRRLLLDNNFILKFFAGAAAGWIHQDFTIHYTSETMSSNNYHFDFRGGGIKSGISNLFYIGKGFNLFSQLALSGLVGRYTNEASIIYNNEAGELINDHLNQASFAFSGQFLMGPSWGMVRDNWGFTIKAEYEINPWFNLNLLDTQFPATNKSHDIYYQKGLICPQGLTISLNLTF